MKTLLMIMMMVLAGCTCPDKKTNDEIIAIGERYINGCEEGVLKVARAFGLGAVPGLVTLNCMTMFLNHERAIRKRMRLRNEIRRAN